VKTVTNTNDFRRYSYSTDTTYLINNFDVQRGAQAPKLRPDSQPQRGLKVRENKEVKSQSELKSEQQKGFAQLVKIGIIAAVSLVMIALVINSLAIKNELTKEIAAKEVKISNAQSEYISLQSELDSLVSMSMIDEYAVNELGMTKVKSNQIQYMDVSEYKIQRENELSQKSPDDAAKQLTESINSNK
jgi:cell division protein FtsL